MITNSKLQVLPATSDNANLFVSLQSNSSGFTNSILSATALTYNPFSKVLTLNGLKWPTADGANGQVLKTDGLGNLTFGSAGLSNFTDTLYTATPNNSIPVAALTATNSGYANIDIALLVKGTGAIVAQVPDNTTVGGNKRGTYSVDFQMYRTGASQVAGSTYSFIGSGQGNSLLNGMTHAIVTGTSNTISSGNNGWRNQFIGGGTGNIITYSNSSTIVSGSNNSMGSGGGTFVGAGYIPNYQFIGAGSSNILNADQGVIVGGNDNQNSGPLASILGGQSGRLTSIWGAIVGGYANQAGATQFQVTFYSLSGKTNIALSADNANIKAGLIFANVANTGTPVTEYTTAVSTYTAAGATFATTSGSGNGTTYTLLHAGGTYAVDSWVTIAGVTTTSGSINGTYIVTASAAGSVSFATTATGTISVQGTVKQSTTITATTAATNSYTAGVTTLFYPGAFIGGGANNQATGLYAIVVGGGDRITATNRNIASGDYSAVVGGYKNVASNSYSIIVGGNLNTVSSYAGFVGSGDNNSITGNYGAVISGFNNVVNSAFGTVVSGYNGNTRGVSGYTLLSTGASPLGVSSQGAGNTQAAVVVLGKQTTDATTTALTANNAVASATNQIALPTNSAYYVKGTIIANVTGAGNTKAWRFETVIKKGASNAATSIVGSSTINVIAADAGASTWGIALGADTTNGALSISVTGQAATTIRWTCRAETTEVTF